MHPPVRGRRVAISTLWRWCWKGLWGGHLEYVRVGRNTATSTEALNRLFNAMAERDKPLTKPPRIERPLIRSTPRSRQLAIEEANRET